MKKSLPSLRQQIELYEDFLYNHPLIKSEDRLKLMYEILRLAYLLKLSEENIPLVVDWLIRESDMHQIKRFEECLEEL